MMLVLMLLVLIVALVDPGVVVLHRETLARDNLESATAGSVGHCHRVGALHQPEGVLPRGERLFQGFDRPP